MSESESTAPAPIAPPGQIPDSRARAREDANRRNARKSTGPRDTKRTRYNATKHGLLSQALTDLDDAGACRRLLVSLTAELAPVGTVETLLVESIALAHVRVKRARRLEAEHIRDARQRDRDRLSYYPENGGSTSLGAEKMSELADAFARYETMHENRLYRALSHLRQLQVDRLRAV